PRSSTANIECGNAPERQVGVGKLFLGPGAVDISPSSGPLTGATPVQICGVDFQNGMAVALGGTDLTSSIAITAANGLCPIPHITVTAPAQPSGSPGTLPFHFQNPDGSTGRDERGFTYTVPAATI